MAIITLHVTCISKLSTWHNNAILFCQLAPTSGTSVVKAMQFIGNPQETCKKMYAIMLRLLERIGELKNDPKAPGN